MARRKQKAIDPVVTLDQAAAAVEASDKDQARTLLRAYRRWRLAFRSERINVSIPTQEPEHLSPDSCTSFFYSAKIIIT